MAFQLIVLARYLPGGNDEHNKIGPCHIEKAAALAKTLAELPRLILTREAQYAASLDFWTQCWKALSFCPSVLSGMQQLSKA